MGELTPAAAGALVVEVAPDLIHSHFVSTTLAMRLALGRSHRASASLLLGRPTIATNVGGLPDLARDGETGWLVPPHSPGALADPIVVGDGLLRPSLEADAARHGLAEPVTFAGAVPHDEVFARLRTADAFV